MSVLILLVFGVLAIFAAGFYASINLLRFLFAFITTNYKVTIVSMSPMDTMIAILNVDLLITFLILLPLILWLIVWYIKPALYTHEQRYLQYVPTIYTLAMLGLFSGWVLSTRLFIPYFQGIANLVGVVNYWSVDNVLSFVLTTAWVSVAIFQIPLIVVLLVNFKIIKPDKLNHLRKVVLLAGFIIGAVATPTVDPITQSLVALIIYALFEMAIQYCRVTKKLTH